MTTANGPRMTESRRPVLRQVSPLRIGLLDQCLFLSSKPSFELLFSLDGDSNIRRDFEVNQPLDSISSHKRSSGVSMLSQTEDEIVLATHIHQPPPLSN